MFHAAAERFTWYASRLRAMSLREIAYRGWKAASATWFGLGAPVRVRAPARVRGFDVDRARLDAQPYLRDAEAILGGHLLIAPTSLVGARTFPPDWNRDPLTGRPAPQCRSARIDVRHEAAVGNVRHVWEVNRHSELLRLAQAWWISRDPRFLDGCTRILQTWFDACPIGRGVNWLSAYEAALRLVNWSFAWRFLHDTIEPALDASLRERWLDSIGAHVSFVRRNLSRHSSANNHLFAELLGVLAATTTWDLGRTGERWRRRAIEELGREAALQFAPDGVNREQAVCYHQQCIDMMLIAQALVEGADVFGPQWTARLGAAIEYLVAVADIGDALPSFGDADRAVLAPLGPDAAHRGVRAFCAAGAWLFGRADLKTRATGFDERLVWWFGERARDGYNRVPKQDQPPPRRLFAEGGVAILGHRFGAADEIRIVADAGPVGYLSIAAHGHADALSFTLSAAGIPVLIDPGVSSYRPNDPWRAYFRGTAAHNTVVVDDVDQSVSGGAFLWLRKACVRIERWHSDDMYDRLSAIHDGYARLADPVMHCRAWTFDKSADTLSILDTLECTGTHRVELNWHFAPGCEVTRTASDIVCIARHDDRSVSVRLALDSRLDVELRRGCEAPIRGWTAARLEHRTPSWTVVARAEMHATVAFASTLQIGVDAR